MDSGRLIAAILLCVYTVFAIRGTFLRSVDNTVKSTDRRAVHPTSHIDWERCKRDWQYAKSTKTLQACQAYLDSTQEYETIANWVRSLLRYYCAHPPRQGTKESEIFKQELQYAAEDTGVPEKGYRNVASFASKTYSSDAPLTINTDGSASYLVLTKGEKDSLRLISTILGLNSYDRYYRQRVNSANDDAGSGRQEQSQRSARMTLDDAYEILGCRISCTDGEIKSAYREMAKRNHPDVLRAQGLPDEMVDVATRKMAEINAAWEMVKSNRHL